VILGSVKLSGKLNPNQGRSIRANITLPTGLVNGSVTPRASLNFSGDRDSSNNVVFSSAQIPVSV
jgi:hypothetical protein